MRPVGSGADENCEPETEFIVTLTGPGDEDPARLFDDACVNDQVQLEVMRRVWRWFEEHPGQTVMWRRGVPGEALCALEGRDDVIIESRLRPDGVIDSHVLSAGGYMDFLGLSRN